MDYHKPIGLSDLTPAYGTNVANPSLSFIDYSFLNNKIKSNTNYKLLTESFYLLLKTVYVRRNKHKTRSS